MTSPRPESLERIASLYATYYHDTELETEAAHFVRAALRGRPEDRAELVEAFDDLLASDLPPGRLQHIVSRYANRATADDEHARSFILETYEALQDD